VTSEKGHQFTVYTDEFRKEIVEESEKARIAGSFLNTFAKSRGIPINTLYSWRHANGCSRKRMPLTPKDIETADELTRSGTNYITGRDYTEHLRRVERYIRWHILVLTIGILGILVCFYWLLLPYCIA